MNLPTSEPLPQDDDKDLPPARRRRKQRMIIPTEPNERGEFLDEIARRMTPSVDYFLFSLLAGLVLVSAILLDSPALFVLAALLAPFMAPAVGLSLAVMVGSNRFFVTSFVAILIGGLLFFGMGTLAGLAANQLPGLVFSQAQYHSHFSLPDLLLLTLGAGLTVYLAVNSSQSRPLVASVALAYELFIPLGVAGFGLTSGVPNLWPDGLIVFSVHLVWVAVIGTVVLVIVGLRPMNLFGYSLGSTIFLALILASIAISGLGTAFSTRSALPSLTPTLTSTVTPSPTLTLTPIPPTLPLTATNTLIPTQTLTLTISPEPTLALANINAKELGGANVHTKPEFKSPVVRILSNGWPIEVYPEATRNEGVIWRKIRTSDGTVGWIWESLIVTVTPKPGW
jgi:uncharacterized membrane protein